MFSQDECAVGVAEAEGVAEDDIDFGVYALADNVETGGVFVRVVKMIAASLRARVIAM